MRTSPEGQGCSGRKKYMDLPRHELPVEISEMNLPMDNVQTVTAIPVHVQSVLMHPKYAHFVFHHLENVPAWQACYILPHRWITGIEWEAVWQHGLSVLRTPNAAHLSGLKILHLERRSFEDEEE